MLPWLLPVANILQPPALPAAHRHTRSECDPSNYDKVHRKPRCTAPGCREKLTSTNSYTCRDCGVTVRCLAAASALAVAASTVPEQASAVVASMMYLLPHHPRRCCRAQVCLRHRLPADHKCPGKAAAAAAAAQNRLGLGSFRRLFSGGSSGSSGSAAASSGAARQPASSMARQPASRPAAGGRAAAAAPQSTGSIQAQLQQYRQQQQQQRNGQAADVIDLTSPAGPGRQAAGLPPASSAGPERCQQCGARFATVQQLIEHAETAHAGGWSSGNIGQQQAAGGGSGGGYERCPHCGQAFSDPVQLVAHVEQQHASSSGGLKDSCVLS